MQEEVRSNLLKYSTPTLSGGIDGLKDYTVAASVDELFKTIGAYNPLEIHIRPSDPDANHYELDWYVLTDWDGQLRRAIDVERESKGDHA